MVRIVPLFVVLVGLCLATPLPRAQIDLSVGIWTYVWERLTFIFGLLPSQTGNAVMPDWSLSLEMQFYLFFPLLAVAMRRLGAGLFFFLNCALAALAASLITYYQGVPPGVFGHYDQPSILPLKIHVFAAGMIAASVFHEGRKALVSWWYLPAFFALFLSCRNHYSILLSAGYISAYLLILWPATSSVFTSSVAVVNAWCERRSWLRWPAEFSYSVYLLHSILFVFVFGGLNRFSGQRITNPLEFLGMLALALTTLNILGFFCHFLIERPAIHLGRRVLQKWLRPAVPF